MQDGIFLNRYRIQNRIASSPQSSVYSALDIQKNNQPVLLSLILEQARQRPLEILYRFRRLTDTITQLSHKNLLKILLQGEANKQDYLVMEAFDAVPLSEAVRKGFSTDQTLDIISQAASCLDYCHEKGILHQTIRPENILISRGADGRIESRLIHFGFYMLQDLSRIQDPEEIQNTFGYLSPEATGILRKPIQVWSDIYSLGILFYHLLAGRPPYRAADISTLIHLHIATQPEPLAKIIPSIDPVLEKMVQRLMAKEPEERYQSLSGFIADLAEYKSQKQRSEKPVDFEIARKDRLKHVSYSTRLIGRETELNHLKSFVDRARGKNAGTLCFIAGEPGIGKSRLVDELRGHVHSAGGLFAGGKCYSYELQTPYKVLQESITSFLDKLKRAPQKEREEHITRIRQAAGDLGAEILKIAPELSGIIGQAPELVELEPDKERIRFLITLTNFILSLPVEGKPLVIFLDDMQWSDDGTMEILERLAEKVGEKALIILVSYRTTEVHKEHALFKLIERLRNTDCSLYEMEIRPFGLRETGQMLSQILLEKETDILPLARHLMQITQGNPFFILELLHTLMDGGIVSLEGDHYRFHSDQFQQASIPGNIVDIILGRVKELSPEGLQILSYAAVMGKEVMFEVLTELAGQSPETVLNSIEEGINNQFLMRDITGHEGVYFSHDRVQEAFYQKVPVGERTVLHRHIAEVLEKKNREDPDRVIYDLAYHYTQAHVEDKALLYSRIAGKKAKQAYANSLALTLLLTARGILEGRGLSGTKEHYELLEDLGEVYRLGGYLEESIATLKECEPTIPRDDIMHRAALLSKMADAYTDRGEVKQRMIVLEQALGILKAFFFKNKLGVGLGILRALVIQLFHYWLPRLFIRSAFKGTMRDRLIVRLKVQLARIYYFTDSTKTFYLMMQALNLAERIGPCPELAYIYTSSGPVWVTFPLFRRAFRDSHKGLKLAQDLQDKLREGSAYAYLTYVYYLANRCREAIAYGIKSQEVLKKIGEYWDLGVGWVFTDMSCLFTGELKKAAQDLEEYIAVMKRVKSSQTLAWGYLNRSRVGLFMGEPKSTIIEDLKEAIKLCEATMDSANMIQCMATLGWAYAHQGKFRPAVDMIEKTARLFPTHFNKGSWCLELFPVSARVYLEALRKDASLSQDERRSYLKRALHFCRKSLRWGSKYRFLLGWAFQVNGSFCWMKGEKAWALFYWEKGIRFLRKSTEDRYRLGSLLLEYSSSVLKDDPDNKRALGMLLEAKELLSQCGSVSELKTADGILAHISRTGEVTESRDILSQRRRLESLLSVTRDIGSVLELDRLLEHVLEYSMKVTGAERGFLLLYKEKEQGLDLKLSRGLEEKSDNLEFSYENYRISWELIKEVEARQIPLTASRESAPAPAILEELNSFQIKQAMAVPLKTKERILGVVYLDNRLAGGIFDAEELELMSLFAIQASVALENSCLIKDLMEQERIKQEMELGKKIQTNLLPKKMPDIKGLRVFGVMLPAKEIGGDYYDFLKLPQAERTGIVIGDVSGKGVSAGLLMAMVKTAMHMIAEREASPKKTLLHVNRILCQHVEGEKFMTMLYFIWDAEEKRFLYSSAGHEHILIYRNRENRVEVIPSGGILLGIKEEIGDILEEKQLELAPGDKILLYTDGVTEAHNRDKNRFGLDRLQESFRRNSALNFRECLEGVRNDVYAFIGDSPQYDDITIVVLEAV